MDIRHIGIRRRGNYDRVNHKTLLFRPSVFRRCYERAEPVIRLRILRRGFQSFWTASCQNCSDTVDHARRPGDHRLRRQLIGDDERRADDIAVERRFLWRLVLCPSLCIMKTRCGCGFSIRWKTCPR